MCGVWCAVCSVYCVVWFLVCGCAELTGTVQNIVHFSVVFWSEKLPFLGKCVLVCGVRCGQMYRYPVYSVYISLDSVN